MTLNDLAHKYIEALEDELFAKTDAEEDAAHIAKLDYADWIVSLVLEEAGA